MSLSVVAWNEEDGELVTYDNRLRVASLEVTTMAEECAAGSSTVILDDATSDWYIYPYRPMYFLESTAVDDPFMGIIGPFWTERRKWTRSESNRTGSRRQVEIELRDINSLLNLRIQKGTDSVRDAETDVVRVTWLINTAEVIGGFGDHGYTIEETEFFFTDAPVDMSESDYTFQYSNGVLDDCMQQSGSNCYLYPAPLTDEPLRIGIWYGRTERTEFASLHKISNDPADISPEYIDGFIGTTPQYVTGYVFPPSFDAVLDRDPSRTITGAGLQYDGDNVYLSNGTPGPELTRRDMVFAGELVKNETQALARLAVYLDENDTEDDAITCSVQVPAWLVHAWVAGQRVQFKATHLASLGYGDYVWMRVAAVTTRQVYGEDGDALGIYDLALDLRAETPPGPAAPAPPGPVPCPDDTPGWEAQSFYPLGQHVPPNGNAAVAPPPGAIQYFRPGITPIYAPDPTPSYINSWHFPTFSSGGFGTQDTAGRNAQNTLRIVVPSSGTITLDANLTGTCTGTWHLFHMDGFVEHDDQTGTGVPLSVYVAPDDFCIHILELENWNGTSGGFSFRGAAWSPDLE